MGMSFNPGVPQQYGTAVPPQPNPMASFADILQQVTGRPASASPLIPSIDQGQSQEPQPSSVFDKLASRIPLPGYDNIPLEEKKKALGLGLMQVGTAFLKHAKTGDFGAALADALPSSQQAMAGEIEGFDKRRSDSRKEALENAFTEARTAETLSTARRNDIESADTAHKAALTDEDWADKKQGLRDLLDQGKSMGLDQRDLFNIRILGSSPKTFDEATKAMGAAFERIRVPEKQAQDIKFRLDEIRQGVVKDPREETRIERGRLAVEQGRLGVERQHEAWAESQGPKGMPTVAQVGRELRLKTDSLYKQYAAEARANAEDNFGLEEFIDPKTGRKSQRIKIPNLKLAREQANADALEAIRGEYGAKGQVFTPEYIAQITGGAPTPEPTGQRVPNVKFAAPSAKSGSGSSAPPKGFRPGIPYLNPTTHKLETFDAQGRVVSSI